MNIDYITTQMTPEESKKALVALIHIVPNNEMLDLLVSELTDDDIEELYVRAEDVDDVNNQSEDIV